MKPRSLAIALITVLFACASNIDDPIVITAILPDLPGAAGTAESAVRTTAWARDNNVEASQLPADLRERTITSLVSSQHFFGGQEGLASVNAYNIDLAAYLGVRLVTPTIKLQQRPSSLLPEEGSGGGIVNVDLEVPDTIRAVTEAIGGAYAALLDLTDGSAEELSCLVDVLALANIAPPNDQTCTVAFSLAGAKCLIQPVDYSDEWREKYVDPACDL